LSIIHKITYISHLIISFISILLFLLCIFVHPVIAQTITVKVGVYENNPKVFTDVTGKPSGIFIEILEYIAHKEGWNLKYVPGTWAEGLDRLVRGEIDLMPDVAYTSAREKIYNFNNEPVLSDWFQIYTIKGSKIKSIVDLAGKRVAVLDRSVQQACFEHLSEGFGIDITIIPMPDYKTIFEKVYLNNADAAITNRFYGVKHAKKFGLVDTAIIFNPTKLFFAAPSGKNNRLLNTIDSSLIDMKKNSKSVYYLILKRWISEKAKFILPDWLRIIILIAVIVLVMSLIGSIILKRQVNLKTLELKKINREMEQRIEQRTAELAAMMEKARSADYLKSAFLATMSHELRTPLNSIIGFTGILIMGLTGPLNEEQLKQLKMLQNSARHLLMLINDILDLSKIEAGQLEITNSQFNLKTSIEKVVSLIRPMVEKKDLELKLEISDEVSEVYSDQRRMEQIIINLLNNAVKFTQKGYIRISCYTDKDQYILSITDTGIGISEEEIPGLFQPFHQIDSGLARKCEGTGLGLSICKKLIVMMGGEIDLQSRLNQGTTFTIRFKINQGDLP